MNIKLAILIGFLFSISSSAVAKEKKITNILNPEGIVIKTGNYISTLEIRAKNTLPHICETVVQARDEQISIPALPLMWSKWKKLIEYTNSSHIKVSYVPKCDANGVVLQIRYH